MRGLDRSMSKKYIRIKNNVANLARAMDGTYEHVESEYVLCMSIAVDLQDWTQYCRVASNRIVLQVERGELESAIETKSKVRRVLKSNGVQIEDLDVFTRVKFGIAELDILHQADLLTEEKFSAKVKAVMELAASDDFIRGQIMVLHIVGSRHLAQGRLFSAIDQFQQELVLAQKLAVPRHIGNALLGLAAVGIQSPNLGEAARHIRIAAPYVQRYTTLIKRWEFQSVIAEFELARGHRTEGFGYLEDIKRFLAVNRFGEAAYLSKRVAGLAERFF
jgi:hypothetical protein